MLEHLLQSVFKISLIVFMVGNLSVMGLQLDVHETIRPLRNVRFVASVLIAGFLLGPVLAYLITLLVPMQRPHVIGLLLLGMAPSAPFLPMVVKSARGSLASAAALMLLTTLGTILVMPFGIPRVAPTLSANTWSIAKPLLSLVLLPLIAGVSIKSFSEKWAQRLYSILKPVTGVGTLVFLVAVVALNYRSFLAAFGTGAFAAQLLFIAGLALGGYLLAFGLPPAQKSVVSLGMCTRNIGAAAAIVGERGDQRIMVVLVIATMVTVGLSFLAARLFRRRSSREALKIHEIDDPPIEVPVQSRTSA
jgi:bile acid:Na+ symporter, BASS family